MFGGKQWSEGVRGRERERTLVEGKCVGTGTGFAGGVGSRDCVCESARKGGGKRGRKGSMAVEGKGGIGWVLVWVWRGCGANRRGG